MDESVETVGTVIDPSGLTVLSLGALNPGAMMNKMMGGGGSGQERMEFGSEPSDVKLRLPGRQGAAGAHRPSRRGSRPRVPAADQPSRTSRWSPSISPTKAVRRCSTPVVVLSRLGRVGGWTPAASLQTIGAIIERPRTFYVIETGSASGVGTPAFTTGGKVVGLLTMRSVQSGQAGHVLDGRRQPKASDCCRSSCRRRTCATSRTGPGEVTTSADAGRLQRRQVAEKDEERCLPTRNRLPCRRPTRNGAKC